MLAPLGFTVRGCAPPSGCEEVQADAVAEVALGKARQAWRVLRRALIVQDSGFQLHTLQNFPGPYTKYVVKTLGTSATPAAHCEDEARAKTMVAQLVWS